MGQEKSQNNSKFCLLLAVILMLLTGCLGNRGLEWQHADIFSADARQQAMAECEEIAREEMLHRNLLPSFAYPPYYDRYYDRRYKPLYWADYFHNRSHYEFLERRRYFRICMRAKGWRLLETPAP